MQTTIMRHILRSLLLGVLLLSLAACYNDAYEAETVEYASGTVGVELTIQTRAIGNITSSSETEYVEGTEWENYIDIAAGDYRIYFFTYDTSEQTTGGKNSTLIAEFKPTDIISTDEGTYTSYYLSGEIDKDLVESLTNFKVLVVANWGTYPTVTAGSTTIDDICNAGTFNAFVDSNGNALMPSSSLHIPFFGLREYSGVTWTADRRTTLNGAITLLRAVAKVEVVLENTDVSFTELTINNYNATGYCAPTGVYLRGDYDHNYSWDDDFVNGLHLVNGANDTDQTGHTIAMYKTTNSDGYETWVAYLPEYDNTSSSAVYSYISARFDFENSYDLDESIYFSNYDANGFTTSNADYDIYRNYLYRFHVKLADFLFKVYVDKWENTWENDFIYEGDVNYTDNPDPDDTDDPYGQDN